MDEQHEIDALESFEQFTDLEYSTEKLNNQTPGKGIDRYLTIDFGDKPEKFLVDIRKEVSNQQVKSLIREKSKIENLLVIAQYIPPRIKNILREKKIGYIDSAGNSFIKTTNHFILIEGKEPPKRDKKIIDRAFTKTGVKLVFYFLSEETLLNETYRDIQSKVDVSLDTISKTIKSLKKQNFIVKINSRKKALTNKEELLNRWATSYETKLKESLFLGTFSFTNKNYANYLNNSEISTPRTVWSGQPAADILTHNLIPENYILYTEEKRNDLMVKYRLKPDEKGNVFLYKKFWKGIYEGNKQTAPPILVYADLLNSNDPRDIEAANVIYEQFIKDRLGNY